MAELRPAYSRPRWPRDRSGLANSPLRRELVSPEPAVVDGFMELPTAPGLGIDLNTELVERWRIDRR
jgi:L-alanine-DL-glutamate epimerase-like enolase superfamily enzyme